MVKRNARWTLTLLVVIGASAFWLDPSMARPTSADRVAVPSASITRPDGELVAVSALSGSDAWAVGTAQAADGGSTLVMHWDGVTWTRVPSPSPLLDAELTGVSAVSTTDVWAVGSYRHPQRQVRLTLVEHWDGTSWTRVRSPNLGDGYNTLSGVSVASDDEGWAVGSSEEGPLLLRWDGRHWSVVAETGLGPDYRLINVSASGPGDAWAVGQDTGFPVSEFVVTHWHGSTWSKTQSAQPPAYGDSPWMSGISARTPTDVWAAGTYVYGQHFKYKGFIEHWDGSTWRQVKAPNPGGFDGPLLTGISADTAEDAWAVGYLRHPILAQRWDGHSWQPVRGPDPGSLIAVDALTPDDVWAVGRRGVRTLIQHWDGTRWSVS